MGAGDAVIGALDVAAAAEVEARGTSRSKPFASAWSTYTVLQTTHSCDPVKTQSLSHIHGLRTLRGSLSPPAFGGRTKGMP